MNIIEELKLLISVLDDEARNSDLSEPYGNGREAGLCLASQYVEDVLKKLKEAK